MGGLKICPVGLKFKKIKCLSCSSRLHAGLKWLGIDRVKLKKLYNISNEQRRIIDKILATPFISWEDFREIQVDSDDVGEAAFSELISTDRETQPDFDTDNIDYAKKLLENALIVHFSILNHLKEEKPDIFILFNGRIAAYRPALRVGVSLGIDTRVFEVHGFAFNKYILTKNSYGHDPIAMGKIYKSTYEQATSYSEAEKNKIASDWFLQHRNGISEDEVSFIKNQKAGYGLQNLKEIPGLKVAIFISSEDEIVCIPEAQSPFFRDQNSAIDRISDDLKNEKIFLIVRAHPFLAGLNTTQMKDLQNVCFSKSNIKYIPPESEVSTYELIDLCDVVLVLGGTTVGIEAVFKGKPTILMGIAAYRGFGGTIEPSSYEELIKILKEAADCGYIPQKYLVSDQAMQHAATVFAFGLIEMGIDLEYQNLKRFDKISWIEKDGKRTYLQPHIFYRCINLGIGFNNMVVGWAIRRFHKYTNLTRVIKILKI